MRFLFSILFISHLFSAFAEVSKEEKKEIVALKINAPIKIDGILDESVWFNAQPMGDFYTITPKIGETPTFPTEIRILYDNDALYIGAVMHDTHPDSILHQLSTRDGGANADNFWFQLNPYNDGQNIFEFGISAANVQSDIKISEGAYDRAWDAVWESEVKIISTGWVVEIRIPFNAIRFPKSEEQLWAINLFRNIRRFNETSSWSLVDRTKGSQGTQAGLIKGIRNIKAPFRLSLYPYISGAQNFTSEGNGLIYSAGMDLKYGINESYTLDITLVPDFTQRKSDDKVLNLSPFEVKYGESRQFFIEGTELFEKAGLFYSRRIGAKPQMYDEVEGLLEIGDLLISNPDESSLINATKITGRNEKGIGIGIFNAMTSNTFAEVKDANGKHRRILTDPFTNYNMLAYDKIIGKYSYLNLINTNLYKPSTNYVANVSGTAFKLSDAQNRYAFYGNSAVSLKYDGLENLENGESYDLNIGKINGNLHANYNFEMLTDTYDPNDMGYLGRNNRISNKISVSYGMYEPVWKFLSWGAQYYTGYHTLFHPRNFTNLDMSANLNATFRNYVSSGLYFGMNLGDSYDFYEPRVDGRFYIHPENYYSSYWISSDYRKPFAFSITMGGGIDEGLYYSYGFSPRMRFSDRFSLSHSIYMEFSKNDVGYAETIMNDTVIFGQRDKQVVTNAISGAYVFNNKSSLRLNLRHYWSELNYQKYSLLNEKGLLEPFNGFKENKDLNYNSFNIDLIYQWNFAPGSFMTVMWKNNINEEESILNNNFYNFWDNLQNTFSYNQANTISIKISYYLDYKYLFKS